MSYNSLFGLGTHAGDTALEGHWLLQDNAASTVVVDSSSNGNDATASANTSTLSTTGPGGHLPSAFAFDGLSTRVDHTFTDTNTDQTIGAWIKTAVNGDRSAVSVADSSSTKQQKRLQAAASDGHFEAMSFDGTPKLVRISDSRKDDGNWHFSVALFENGGGRGGYTDGYFRPITGPSDSISNLDRFTIGVSADSTPWGFWDGDIAGAFRFDRLLTETECGEVEAGPEPLNLTAPAVSGTHETGQTLTTSNGTWDNQANGTIAYTYQWQRADDASGTNAADISGATSSTYTLTASDENKYVRATIVASNDGGSDPSEDQATAWTLVTSGGGGPTFQPAWAINATMIATRTVVQ